MSNFREKSADVGQSVKRESLTNPDKFTNFQEFTPELLNGAIDDALSKVRKNIHFFASQYPEPSSKEGVYEKIDNNEWTSGFWSGQIWLAYELSGENTFLQAGLEQIESYHHRIENRIVVDHHDLGFLYSLSCVAAYKNTGNQSAKNSALLAADCLLERYLKSANIIQAWGNLNDPKEAGRMIIDCNLNLPLLYWASEETGNLTYKEAANNHIRQSLRYLIRPDASTYHTYFIDTATGKGLRGATHQGFSDSSCWSRGQAWGISGLPLVYRFYPAPALIEQSCRLTNYFLNRLPDDLVCYWDLDFTSGSQPRDSSSAAIAVCGILELLKYLPLNDPDRKAYETAAKSIMASLIINYTNKQSKAGNGLIEHGVYHQPNNVGVDEYCIWGDYFYLEALTRFKQTWEPYW
ncbi:MAG: glycoside hydrolase family 88 protein [Colwellia sp.]